MTSSPTTRRLAVAACALVAAAALTGCGGRTELPPAAAGTALPTATTAPATGAAGAGAPSTSVAASTRAGSTRPSTAADPELVKVRRQAAEIDLDAPGTRVERVETTIAGTPGFLVTTWMGSAAVTIEVFRAPEDLATVCTEGDPGCALEALASAPNSLYFKAQPKEIRGVLTSSVDVRLSYTSTSGDPWAARVVATGPDDDAFPGQDELCGTAAALAMVLVDPKDVPAS